MVIKPQLNLRVGQHMTMTPQLQQAIRLLQLSSTELQQEVQEALDTNIMLDPDEGEGAAEQTTPQPAYDTALAEHSTPVTHEETLYRELPGSEHPPGTIPGELPVDLSWDDIYGAQAGGGEDEDPATFQRGENETLHNHLLWQAELARFNERDYAIAMALVDAVNADGYLEAELEDLYESLGTQLSDTLELDEVLAVLHRVQTFDPPGIAARDLGECLSLQLRQLPENTPGIPDALALIREHLNLLARNDLARIRRLMGLDDDALARAIHLVRSLNPRPGQHFAPDDTAYIVPDVFVRKIGDSWVVALNPDTSPRLRINPYYSGLVRRMDDSPANQTLRNHLLEARWFLKSLQSRHDTLLKVAQAIVAEQQGFLEHGAIAMKPLVLRDIAGIVAMHESTISRITTNKYMRTPSGTFELKYFFSSHVATASGGECSAVAIKAQIREMIENEATGQPLSDLRIAQIFLEQGVRVARRTVTKYREALRYPPSHERRRMP